MEFTTKKDLIEKIRKLALRIRVLEELSVLVKKELGISITYSTLSKYVTVEEKEIMRRNMLKNPRSRKKREWKSEETRDVIVNMMLGKKGPESRAWKGGSSFKPYCHLFTNILKEEIRNRDNRVCQLCGKSELLNSGKRLAVHHIDGNKMQGCNSTWYLCALCNSCNSKADTVKKEFLIVSNMKWY